MSARKEPEWSKTGTVAGMADWLRKKSGALAVIVIRVDNSVLSADDELAPMDVRGLVHDHLPLLVSDLARARTEKRAARLEFGELHE